MVKKFDFRGFRAVLTLTGRVPYKISTASIMDGFVADLSTRKQTLPSLSTIANVFSVLYGICTIFVASSTFIVPSPLL